MPRLWYYLFIEQLAGFVACDEPCADVACGEVYSVDLLQTDLQAHRGKVLPRLGAQGQKLQAALPRIHGATGDQLLVAALPKQEDISSLWNKLWASQFITYVIIFTGGFLHLCWACYRELLSQKSAANAGIVIWMPVGYLDGRSPIVGSDLWLRLCILLGVYLSLGLGQHAHRWSCLNYAMNLLFHRLWTRLRLPLWAGVLFCYSVAFRFVDWHTRGMLFYPTCDNFLKKMLIPCDMLEYSMTPGQSLWGIMFKGCGTYLAWIQIAKVTPDTLARKVLGRPWVMGVLAALAWYWLAGYSHIEAMVHAVEQSGGSMAAVMNVFSTSLVQEWCVMLTLLLAVGQGNFLLQLLGKNMVGTYLVHSWVLSPDLYGILRALEPGGIFVQTVAALWTASMYMLSVGAAVQALLVQLLRRLQGRNMKGST